MELAALAGLFGLVGEFLTVSGSAGVNAQVEVPALVAWMVCGAGSISDLDLLRHGGVGRVFPRTEPPRRWALI